MSTEIETKRLPRIVLIEDNAGDVFLIKHALERNAIKCELVRYEDGEAAMKALSPGAEPPVKADLILLDLNLPRRDGREILRVAKEHPALAHTPIAIITSSFSAADREDALKGGAARYIHKPSSLAGFVDDVGSAIKALLE